MVRRTTLRRGAPLAKSGRRAPQKKVLDALCRALVFQRDGNRCVRCGSTKNLQWAHVYSRRYLSIRWVGLNSMVLCAKDHLDWHHRPIEASAWWTSWVGETRAAMLRATLNARGRVDLTATELRLRQGVI